MQYSVWLTDGFLISERNCYCTKACKSQKSSIRKAPGCQQHTSNDNLGSCTGIFGQENLLICSTKGCRYRFIHDGRTVGFLSTHATMANMLFTAFRVQNTRSFASSSGVYNYKKQCAHFCLGSSSAQALNWHRLGLPGRLEPHKRYHEQCVHLLLQSHLCEPLWWHLQDPLIIRLHWICKGSPL
jgi:hypothetical protein